MQLHPAQFFQKLPDGKVICNLCPQHCVISRGMTGMCRVRENKDGELFSTIYGKVASIHMDPVEKKPLYHFFPGKSILSIGAVGCNLRCNFCQNFEISQAGVEEVDFLREYNVNQILSMAALDRNNAGIAFTYNEPGIWIEFMLELATQNRSRGMKNVMVTNGYLERKPLESLVKCIDAFSVDLKGFSDTFYKRILQGKLKPVLDNLEFIKASGCHLELVNLVIPGLNDDLTVFEKMIEWITGKLGKDTVLHISAYSPRYLSNIPPTPQTTLFEMKTIAKSQLDFVYCGNIPGEVNNTICPFCGNMLISRHNYSVTIHGLDSNGGCKKCKNRIIQNF